MLQTETPITDIIRRRFSCRTYRPEPIRANKRKQLQAYIDALPSSPFGSLPRFALIAATETDWKSLRGLGTYGFIKNPPAYILGAMTPSEYALEDFGYLMEIIILYATNLNLGTCWLGGTFTKSSFGHRMDLAENESIPAVTSVGDFFTSDQARKGWASRKAVSHRRIPWEELFFNSDFNSPLSPEEAGNYAAALEMVRLAPSASNKQPWRIVRRGRFWRLFLRRTPGYRRDLIKRILDLCDLQRLDMGIAMSHFELSAREMGLDGRWVVEDGMDLKPDEMTEYIVSWESLDG